MSAGAPAVAERWTVLRMILWSADYLEGKGVESPRLDAEHLLAHVVGVDRLQLYLDFERPLDSAELDGFRPLLKRRAAREPLQYILGRQPFRELDLEVRPGVLIPRPETELLVGEVLAWCAESGIEALECLDVGTGTGAIALSLATEGAFSRVVATDVSEAALTLARHNLDALDPSVGVDLRSGSIFEPLGADERFHVIVSNPPYVPEVDAASLQPEVRDWEPAEALFSGDDGMDFIRRFVADARPHLDVGGLLALDVGAGQAQLVAQLLRHRDEYDSIRVLRDYSGRERFVFAQAA